MTSLTLRSDNKGFLLGDPLELDDALNDIPVIRADLAAIRKLMEAASKVVAVSPPSRKSIQQETNKTATSNPSSTRKDSFLPQRVEAVSATGSRRDAVDTKSFAVEIAINHTNSSNPSCAIQKVDRREAVSATGSKRDVNGCFFTSDSSSDSNNPTEATGVIKRVAEAVNKVSGGIDDLVDGNSEIDPAIAAAQEIKGAVTPVVEAVTPIGRSVMSLFDGGNNEEAQKKRWYRSITNNLNWLRRDANTHHKREYGKLKEIEDGQGEKGGNGLLKIAAAVTAAIAAGMAGIMKKVGLMSAAKAMGNIAAGAGGRANKGSAVYSAGGKGGKAAHSGFSRVAGAGKGLLGKIPLFGALLAGISVAGNEFSSDMTRREKDGANGSSVGVLGGGLAGASLGATIGTMILPGIGTIVGGAAGAFFGGEAGAIIGNEAGLFWNDLRTQGIGDAVKNRWGVWVGALESTDVGSFMISHYGGAVDSMVIGWNNSIALFDAAWADVSNWSGQQLDSLNAWVKSWSGLDLKAIITEAIAGIGEFIDPAIEKVTELKNKVLEEATPIVNQVITTTSEIADKAVDAATEKAKSWWDKAVDFVTVDQSSPQPSTAVEPRTINKLLKSQGTTRVFENSDGSVEKREGGTVSWRNNNPGNLKFEHAGSADKSVRSKRSKKSALASAQKRYEGVVDLDHWGNAVFATEAHGQAAKAKLLTKMHGDKTVEQMLPKYAIDDYSGRANHAAYSRRIHKTASERGANLNGKRIRDMSPKELGVLMEGMKSMEGWRAGKVATVKSAATHKMPTILRTTAVSAKTSAVPKAAVTPALSKPPKPVKLAAAPAIVDTTGSNAAGSKKDKQAITQPPIADASRDLPDRQIAHAISGGMGGLGKNHLLSG